MQKKKFTLKKLNRLKSKKSFQIVYVKGRTVVDAMSVFYILPDQGEDIKNRSGGRQEAGLCCGAQPCQASDA